MFGSITVHGSTVTFSQLQNDLIKCENHLIFQHKKMECMHFPQPWTKEIKVISTLFDNLFSEISTNSSINKPISQFFYPPSIDLWISLNPLLYSIFIHPSFYSFISLSIIQQSIHPARLLYSAWLLKFHNDSPTAVENGVIHSS